MKVGEVMINIISTDVERLIKKYRTRNPFEIASGMNINIVFENLGNLKGYYFYQSRFRYIVINQKINDKFKSIICAHELGHDRLHQHFARNNAIREFSLFDMSSKPEREANLFATELLIPDNTIMDFVKQEYTYEFIAAKLDIPVELVDFKSQILKNKGYDINPIQIANSEFLRK